MATPIGMPSIISLESIFEVREDILVVIGTSMTISIKEKKLFRSTQNPNRKLVSV
jgi:hypothetical protein